MVIALEGEKESEDMGGLFFDADGDGDEDLYVVSGGVEHPGNHEAYRDRLYINDGKGGFAKGELPDLRDSGGCVAAADFDRDGDLDLFVGTRVRPGAYPTSTRSRLLVNNGGDFADKSETLADGFGSRPEMVTSAIWSDIDADGWIDLLVAHEWGPIRVWKNNGGKLEDHSEESGTSQLLGWWNSIAAGDLDRDGDMDYVVGNFGNNTKYHVPAILYYGDFDGTGKNALVEAEVEGDVVYPIRGKSCSSHAIPALANKFKLYREFAAASLGEIYTESRLDEATRFEANTLTSGVLRNHGDGKLNFEPFTDPIAQIAPVFGIVVSDFDTDGLLDLFLAQNFYSPQPETGRMDGGLSAVMLGDGEGGFSAMRAAESGIAIAADAKCATLDGDDLLVGINNGAWRRFENKALKSSRKLTLKLHGRAGNSGAIGARVQLYTKDETVGVIETSAGSGYLSQAATSRVTLPDEVTRIEIRWPDGSSPYVGDVPETGDLQVRQGQVNSGAVPSSP